MARLARIDIEGGVYHVMSCGNDRCDLFKVTGVEIGHGRGVLSGPKACGIIAE